MKYATRPLHPKKVKIVMLKDMVNSTISIVVSVTKLLVLKGTLSIIKGIILWLSVNIVKILYQLIYGENTDDCHGQEKRKETL